MKLLVIFVLMFSFLLPLVANAGRPYGRERVDVYVQDGNRETVHHSGPRFDTSWSPNPCFPFRCGGIEGPFRNPDPTARDPENLTACIYGADNALLYERKGKVCAKVYGE